MGVSLWVPTGLQFGELAFGEARQGAMRQALAQAIKGHLFGEDGGDADQSYEAALGKFATALGPGLDAPESRPAARTLWAALFPVDEAADACAEPTAVEAPDGLEAGPVPSEVGEDPAASSPVEGPVSVPAASEVGDVRAAVEMPEGQEGAPDLPEPGQVPERVEMAFCFSVHGLCAALALHWVEALDRTDDDAEDGAGDESDTESTSVVAPSERDWRADYSQVVRGIAALLRQAVWRWLRDDSLDETNKAEDLRLVATVLLDALIDALGDWFVVTTAETGTRNGRPHTPKYITLRRPVAQRIDGLVAALPFRFTVQPLKQPVVYRLDDRGPANRDEANYVRIDLIGYRRTNAFLRRFHAGAVKPPYRAPELLRYVEALNVQQAVPWRINQGVLYWARCLIASVGGESRLSGAESQVVAGIDPDALAAVGEWVRKDFYRPLAHGPRKTIERPGEFLDSPLALRVLEELGRDGPDGKPVPFYLPWKADYRGRIYAETPWLTPQGGDLQRALFEFSRGKVLDEGGVRALRRHGANLVRRARLLADLNISGRQVTTLGERERWVETHEAEILASAQSPLSESFWRTVAGKPMQFLAFCLAYRQWTLDPSAPIHLPVQIDGTCNGLQHIAALTGDTQLARAVNVLPREDGLPGDIYSELAAAAADTLGRLPASKGQAVHREGLELADAWLAASPLRRAWLNRDTAKKVVMTIPYGASWGAQARHVIEAIADAFEAHWREAAPSQSDLDALVAWKEEDKARAIFVARCTRGLFRQLRQATFAGADELATASATTEWQHRRTLAAYVALAIVGHLHGVLTSRFPSVNAFSGWLKKTAGACSGLPLLWQSPLGFPVCQDKFRLQGTSVTARLGAKAVRIDVQRLADAVDPIKQRDALLPNLIHSLDATHLAMTLLDAKDRGVDDIGSIHDCLLCHPNDAAALGRVVRRSFARLYGPGRLDLPDPLIRWRDWMALLVDLRAVHLRGELLAALVWPGEQAERDLDHFARRGDRDAVRASDLLAVIRRRDPSERFLVRMLLEQAVSLPVPEAPPAMPSPPFSGALPLGNGALSEYFFS